MVGCCYVPKRYILVVIAHLGFVVVYALRVNLSVALVAMVNDTHSNTDPHTDPECHTPHNTTSDNENGGEFNWNQNQQGLILSSFFYGYLFTQLPGGYLANKYGGRWVFGIGVLCTALLTLLTPVAARTSFYLLLAVRALEGVGEGVTFPAMHCMIGKWAPPTEKTRFVALSYSGANVGTIISLPVSSILATSSVFGGWPSAFYVFGVIGIVWFVGWILIVRDSPDQHSTISIEEKTYILDSQRGSSSDTGNTRVPWLPIFTSRHVWAIIVAHFCHSWVWYLVLTGLPSYFKQVLNFNLTENGFLSALPFVVSFLTTVGSGVAADYLSKWVSMTTVRRVISLIAFYCTAVCLILASYTSCDQIMLSVVYMVIGTGFLCINQSGFNANHLDLSPRFCGVLLGITNFFGTLAGCITPSVTGYFTNHEPTRKQYRKVFLLAAIISVIGGTWFGIFVSGEQQVWNDVFHRTDSKRNILVMPGGSRMEFSGDETSSDDDEEGSASMDRGPLING